MKNKLIKIYHFDSGDEIIFSVETNKTEKTIKKDWQKCVNAIKGDPELDLVLKNFKKLGYKIINKNCITIEYGF